MKVIKYTLLQCLAEKGVVMGVVPSFRAMTPGDSTAALNEAITTARQEAAEEAKDLSRFSLDRILVFKGHLSPCLGTNTFREAVMACPGLIGSSPLGRFYPEAPEQAGEDDIFGPDTSARYLLLDEDGDAEGLQGITLVLKDHVEDEYILHHLLVDPKEPAAAVMLYLGEQTDGRMQPVAAFPGLAERFHAPAGSDEPARSRPVSFNSVADPLGRVMIAMLDAALERAGTLEQAPDNTPGRGLEWLVARLQSRAVIALTSDIPFVEQPLVRLARQRLGLSIVNATPLGPAELILTLPTPPNPALVILSMNTYPRLADPERVANDLASGEHAVLVSCFGLRDLPDSIRNLVEESVVLPRMDRELFARAFVAVFGVEPPLGEDSPTWIRYVQPTDIARIAKRHDAPEKAFLGLQRRVEERMQRLTPKHGPSLRELCGLGDAKRRAEALIADIRAALAGDIAWDAVDHGMLLVGPPGCGKTTLARAIAKECGVHFLECSAASWQMAGYLNEHLAAMARDFQEARRFSPSIIFIDEVDSIGNREHFSGSNASYHTQVVNALLAELQGFSDREKVIVIAATNNLDALDPALRRAGRLDRVVPLTLPTIDALEKIFEYYLQRHGALENTSADIASRPLAEAVFGKTGADVSLVVRGALRRARLEKRPLNQGDLLAEIYNRPLDTDFARPLHGEGLRRVAIHEAGHAAVRLAAGESLAGVAFLSIVPRPDGSLGFMATRPDPDLSVRTRNDYLALMTTVLAGRAAEEVFYGAEAVGAGAGGGASSDLARAMSLALDMTTRLGLGREFRLCWRDEPNAEDVREAEALLAEAYSRALEVATARRETIERIAAALVERQELSGEELRLLLHGAEGERPRPVPPDVTLDVTLEDAG